MGRSISMICLAVAFSFGNILLAFFGQNGLTTFLIAGAVTYLIIIAVCLDTNPRSVADLNIVSAIILAGFLVYVILQVIDTLKRAPIIS